MIAVFIGAVGFFGGMNASAKNSVQIEMPMGDIVHCVNENQVNKKTGPADNALMPCCLERHDNSRTVMPPAVQERVKLMQSLMSQQINCASNAIEQKIYPSSPSPPFEAENISSTVKIE